MSKDPAVLFYTSDFLTGVTLLSMAQRGKYITLLCLQHQKGRLTEKEMVKVCGNKDADIFAKFEKDEEGLYFNVRMEKEANKRNSYVESRRANRLAKTEDMTTHMSEDMDTHMTKHMENENINEDIYKINKGGVGGKKRFTKPTVDEVKEYCIERKNGIDPNAFVDFYEAKGWRIGKDPMKDWKACVRTWEQKRKVTEYDNDF